MVASNSHVCPSISTSQREWAPSTCRISRTSDLKCVRWFEPGQLVGSADRDVDIDESVDLFMFSGYLQGCLMEYNDPQPTVSAHISETSREPPKCDLSALRISMLAAW
jgi:hypothetical protein